MVMWRSAKEPGKAVKEQGDWCWFSSRLWSETSQELGGVTGRKVFFQSLKNVTIVSRSLYSTHH